MRLTHKLLCGGLIVCAAAIFNGRTLAEEKEKEKVGAISRDKADADYALQGEFAGSIETEDGALKYGVQVIALGKGKFRAVGYPGGLPGDGWTRENRIEVESETVNGEVVFKSERARSVLTKDKLDIRTLDSKPIAELKKVERKSPTLGKKPPEGAVVLFDGKSADKFEKGRMSDDGLLMQGATSKQKFGDCSVHLEFMLSYMPEARGQQRSNSGVYLQGRHEAQILDSFGLAGDDHECGGIYEVSKPAVNMCYPPLAWQTYDIDFTAAKFDAAGKKTANARMTVLHNGTVIQKDVEVPKTTRSAPVAEGPEPGPLYIQDHGDQLRFRNIWVVEKK
ncbi:MAG: DUF1080 domain-containing protein [Planctomycetaceae bacterium]